MASLRMSTQAFSSHSLAFACLILLAAGQHVAGQPDAPAPPRDKLLLDFGWRFHLGDATDSANKLDYPEVKYLDKTGPSETGKQGTLPGDQNDPVGVNLGADISFVQPSFDDTSWTSVNLPYDWAIRLPFQQPQNHDDLMHGSKPIGPVYTATGNNIGWYRRKFDLPATDKDKALLIQFDGVYRNSVVWLNGHCIGREISGYTSFSQDISKFANYGGSNTLVVRADATRYEGGFMKVRAFIGTCG